MPENPSASNTHNSMDATEQKNLALQKHRAALDLLEKAQNLVNTAAQEICSVNGLSDEWTTLCQLHDNIKAHWHELEDGSEKIQGISTP